MAAAARRAQRPGIGTGRWRTAELPANDVTRAVERLGGAHEAARIGGTTAPSVYAWCRKPPVTKAGVVLRWVAALESGATAQLTLARQIAGVEITRAPTRTG